MNTFPPADTVTYRHPCDCETASRPLQDGEQPEHRFDVNGQPFPWHITADGARFEKHGGIYVVRCTMYPMLTHNHEMCTITIEERRPPLITPCVNTRAAQYFPWLLTERITLTQTAADPMPTLQLAFLAEHIDVDCEVKDITQ